MLDDRWQRAAGYQTLRVLVLPLRSGESVHRVHHRFEQYNGWVSENDVSANRMQWHMCADPVFMYKVWGAVMRAIHHSIVSSQLIRQWSHSRIFCHVKDMQAFRPEPIPQGCPNSEPWKGVILTLFGGNVSGYRMEGFSRGIIVRWRL
jgi:hypothetical protein